MTVEWIFLVLIHHIGSEKGIFYDISLMLYLICTGARLESTHVKIITSLRGHLLLVKPPYFLWRNKMLICAKATNGGKKKKKKSSQ